MALPPGFIPIDNQIEEFKFFIDINDRVIFSGRFGDGKTVFLNEFIEQKKAEYLFIPIYPVNYQIADNKDIFEYIKRDILIRLLMTEDISIDDSTFSKSLLIYNYIINNPLNILEDVISCLPNISILGTSIDIGKSIENLRKINDKLKKQSETFDSEENKIDKFINTFNNQKGSIYEFDLITQLICDIIERYKKAFPQRQVVLLIEDLDRIDPAHIFRILNIFSAHFDRQTMNFEEIEKKGLDNKFTFDKVVIVCDCNNLEKIYSHFYGNDTDFRGYISKFSTSDNPFNFSLSESLKKFIMINLDEDIRKYQFVSEVLAEKIVEQYYGEYQVKPHNNIRIINNRLSQPFALKEELINVRLPNDISSINPLTKFLDILRLFNIPADEFIFGLQKRKDSQYIEDFYDLVGVCWLCAFQAEKLSLFKPHTDSVISYGRGTIINIPLTIVDDVIKEMNIKPFRNNSFMSEEFSHLVTHLDSIIRFFKYYLISY